MSALTVAILRMMVGSELCGCVVVCGAGGLVVWCKVICLAEVVVAFSLVVEVVVAVVKGGKIWFNPCSCSDRWICKYGIAFMCL